MALNLFPVRCPIGRAAMADGTFSDVLMTPEFARALSDLLERIGGEVGMGVDEITTMLADLTARPLPIEPEQFQQPAPELAQVVAEMQAMRQEIADLQQQVAQFQQSTLSAADLEQIAINPGQPVDWEHPGQIGFRTPTTGAFTVLRTGAGAVGTPSFYLASDTTTGLYRIGANNLGLSIAGVNLMNFAATLATITGALRVITVPRTLPSAGNTASFDTNGANAVSVQFGGDEATGYTWQRNIQQGVGAVPHRFYLFNTVYMTLTTTGLTVVGNVSVNAQLISTVAVGTPPLVVTSTTQVPNLYVARAALADNATAATSATSANTANTLTSPTAYPANATDLPTAITLVNALKTAALAKGL